MKISKGGRSSAKRASPCWSWRVATPNLATSQNYARYRVSPTPLTRRKAVGKGEKTSIWARFSPSFCGSRNSKSD